MRRSIAGFLWSRLAWGIGWVCFVLVMLTLADILLFVIRQGAIAMTGQMFLSAEGTMSLLRPLFISLFLTVISWVVSVPVGVAGGIFTAELATLRLGNVLRVFSHLLSGMPSVIAGYAVYVLLVWDGGTVFSLWAAVVALVVILLPSVLGSTDAILSRVPKSSREAALSLGLTRVQVVTRVLARPALGKLTRELLILTARCIGETAPLLFTAGWVSQLSGPASRHGGIPYLTETVLLFVTTANSNKKHLASAALLLLLVLLLLLHGLARIGRKHRESQPKRPAM